MSDNTQEEFEKWWFCPTTGEILGISEKQINDAWYTWQAATAQSEQTIADLRKKLAEQQAQYLMLRGWFQKDGSCTCETCWSCAGKGAAVLSEAANTEELNRLITEAKVQVLKGLRTRILDEHDRLELQLDLDELERGKL